ncbi:MAG TPA: EpsI family protein [Pyrinomonadaceae bacterium]|nr:EpsI family protein [Pyrinomonadaceae bacterium]
MFNSGFEKRYWILLVALLLGGVVINVWGSAGEAKVAREPLKSFPSQIGKWKQQGPDMRFDAETEKVLRADDYISRSYTAPNGRMISFYAGYYASQRTGATYHSPLNCLPGAGWVMTDMGRIAIQPAGDRAPFQVNRYLVQNGNERALMLYWYEGRGRPLASEYWAKIYTVIDSVKRRRSDGAMVRVMVPLANSPDEAQAIAVEVAAQAAAQMPAFVPD